MPIESLFAVCVIVASIVIIALLHLLDRSSRSIRIALQTFMTIFIVCVIFALSVKYTIASGNTASANSTIQVKK